MVRRTVLYVLAYLGVVSRGYNNRFLHGASVAMFNTFTISTADVEYVVWYIVPLGSFGIASGAGAWRLDSFSVRAT